MSKDMLSLEEINEQTALELPERALLTIFWDGAAAAAASSAAAAAATDDGAAAAATSTSVAVAVGGN